MRQEQRTDPWGLLAILCSWLGFIGLSIFMLNGTKADYSTTLKSIILAYNGLIVLLLLLVALRSSGVKRKLYTTLYSLTPLFIIDILLLLIEKGR